MSRARTRCFTTLLILSLLFVAGGASAATLTGKVDYEGRTPNLKALQMDADPACQAMHSAPVRSELLVLGEGNALANVFVYVKSGLPNKDFPPPSEPAVLDQQGCIYAPHALGVMAGQPLKILNSDGLLHNVHSMSKVNSPFNRAMPGSVKEAEFEMAKPEEMFRVKCDVHPWMGANIIVFDHPFFAVTGEDGSFKIEGLPAGTYEIEARHEFERFPPQTISVTVGEDESKTMNFTFKGPST